MSHKFTVTAISFALGTVLALPAAKAQTFSPATASLQASTAAQGSTKIQYYSAEGYRGAPDEYYGDGDWDSEEGPAMGVAGPVEVEAGAYDDASGEALCQARFRSYDPASGTYTTYDGDIVPCPYLR
jgi:BA14K-like protein